MSQKTVLYVDDEGDIRLVVQACLEDAGYRVLTAPSAAEGLTLAQSQFPDLIISDVMMPEESGYSFCEKLKADPSTKDIPVVFLTVMEDEITGMKVGATAFLTKPFEEEELLKTVSDLLKPTAGRAGLDTALEHLRGQRWEEGMEALRAVIDEDPTGTLAPWARYYLGQVHQMRGERERAREHFLAVLAQEPGFWRAHGRLGLLFEEVDPPRAAKHFERALSLNPNQPDVAAKLEKLQGSH